jgi:hypothetical protein
VIRRRTLLKLVVAALLVSNAIFLTWHFRPAKAQIFHIGLDSLMLSVPERQTAAALQNGVWEPSLAKASLPVSGMAGDVKWITLVTLAPDPTYGRFIQAVRALKARGTCNVLVREGADLGEAAPPFSGPRPGPPPAGVLDVPAIVLCGSSIGDAGFSGKLPPNGEITIEK